MSENIETKTRDRKNIVVGIDGSDSSIAALREAARLADLMKKELTVMICWRDPAGYGYVAPDWSPGIDAGNVADSAMKEVFGTDAPDHVELQIHKGRPAAALVDASRDAAMLVVGSRGHGGFMGMLLGSVSAACAEYAHCPVLVYHEARD